MTNLEFLKSLWLATSSINEELLQQALTHKSFATDFPAGQVPFNERLEFLGDSILGAAISRLLFDDFPDLAESKLSLSRSFLVRESSLTIVAKNINLWSVVRIWVWETRSGGIDKPAILSDTLEALIAFIYLQYGRETIEEFVKKHVYVLLSDEAKMTTKSSKNRLQELVQKYHNEIPKYVDEWLETDASGDIKLFGSKVYVLGEFVCEGTWVNKQTAQKQAASKALEMLEIVEGEVVLKK